MSFVVVFHDHDLKHPWQADEGSGGQKDEGGPAPGIHMPLADLGRINLVHHRTDAASNAPDNEERQPQSGQTA